MRCSDCKSRKYCDNADKVNYCAGYIFDDSKPKMQTKEEWLRSCPPQELIRFLMNVAYGGQIRSVQKSTFDEEAEKWSKWLKEKHHAE